MILDSTTRTRLLFLYPKLADDVRWVITRVHELTGYEMRITESLRTFEQQRHYYKQGRENDGKIITCARAGWSLHHYGLAADLAFHGNDPYLDHHSVSVWETFGMIANGRDLRWGGNFALADKPHIEARYPIPLERIIKEYRDGGTPGVWATLDQILGIPTGQGWHDLGATQRPMSPGTLTDEEARYHA